MFGIIGAAICAVGSAVASFVGSVGSAVATIGTGICSAFMSITSAIGPTLANIGKTVVDGIKGFIARFPEMNLDQIKTLIETTMKIIHKIMDVLGLNKHQMEQDEIGERAMQNPEIKPEDYDTTEEYIEKLHECEYKKGEHPKGISDDAWRAMCAAVGTGIEVKAISEKMQMATPLTFFADCAKAGLAAKDIVDGKGGGVLERLKEKGVADTAEFSRYLGGEKCGTEIAEAMSGVVTPESGLSVAQMREKYAAGM